MSITRTVTRTLPSGRYVVGHLQLRLAAEGERFAPDGCSPGFSVTGEIYEPPRNATGATRRRQGREPETCGALGDEIARVFPRLRLLCDLHLSDPDGVPMHAEANGWYFYAASRADLRGQEDYTGFDVYAWRLAERGLTDDDAGREEYCRQMACKILRVDEIPAFEGPPPSTEIGPRRDGPAYESRRDYTRRMFAAFVDAQRPRWAAEACAARKILEDVLDD